MLRPRIFEDNFTDDLFEDMFRFPFGSGKNAMNFMSTDVKDLGESYQLDIELPGFKKEDINAELKNGYLTIHANHTEEIDKDGKEGSYVRKERYSGQCQRSFYVGEHLKEEDIKAKFENGILKLVFPKDEKKQLETTKYIMIE